MVEILARAAADDRDDRVEAFDVDLLAGDQQVAIEPLAFRAPLKTGVNVARPGAIDFSDSAGRIAMPLIAARR